MDPEAEAKSIHRMNRQLNLDERRCSCPESLFFRIHRTTTLTGKTDATSVDCPYTQWLVFEAGSLVSPVEPTMAIGGASD